MAWKLPDGKTISSPKGVLIGDTQYSADIFYRWSKEELAAIGIKPYREESFDSKWYKSIGFSETEIDGEIVKTHTIVPKMTVTDAQETQVTKIKNKYISEFRRSTELADFYDAVGDSDSKKLWDDYCTDLKNDAKSLKDIVDVIGSYDDIVNLDFEWTAAPDGGDNV